MGWQIAGSLPKPFTGVVAYEPVWAIGTGRTATEQDVATMHAFIREELVRQFGEAGQGVRILYGGSMRPANAELPLRLKSPSRPWPMASCSRMPGQPDPSTTVMLPAGASTASRFTNAWRTASAAKA